MRRRPEDVLRVCGGGQRTSSGCAEEARGRPPGVRRRPEDVLRVQVPLRWPTAARASLRPGPWALRRIAHATPATPFGHPVSTIWQPMRRDPVTLVRSLRATAFGEWHGMAWHGMQGGGDFMHAGALDYAMHNYAQLCTIMHNYAGCIATKTHRDCKQEGTWDCDPPQTDNTVKSAAAIHAYFGQKITLLSLLFRWWKNFIVRQNIFSSGSMCMCILLDKIVHDKHNNKLHWTRVEQTIMHNYAQLCTIMHNYAQLCNLAQL